MTTVVADRDKRLDDLCRIDSSSTIRLVVFVENPPSPIECPEHDPNLS